MTRTDHDIGPAQPPQDPPAKSGIVGAFAVAVLLGAMAGGLVGRFWLPGMTIVCALAGAALGAALRGAILLSSNRKGLAKVEDEDGTLQ